MTSKITRKRYKTRHEKDKYVRRHGAQPFGAIVATSHDRPAGARSRWLRMLRKPGVSDTRVDEAVATRSGGAPPFARPDPNLGLDLDGDLFDAVGVATPGSGSSVALLHSTLLNRVRA